MCAQSGRIGFDRTGTENEYRNIQRQDQQCQQYPCAAYAQRQRGADAADQTQGRCAEQQREGEHTEGVAIESEL